MMGYGYNMMGGWLAMMIIPIILIGVAIFIYYKKGDNINVKNIKSRDNSLDILNERFARGEINEEEYNQKKNAIKK